MAITLAQAQINAAADVDYAVIDNLRRNSWVFDRIVFDDVATPGTGGGSLTYGYTRLTTPRTADFRDFNTEYTAKAAVRARVNVDLKPLGGKFAVDRALANLGPASSNEVSFQMQELLTATVQRFQYELINGDVASGPLGFDGLNKVLTGTTTEYDPLDQGATAGYLDWTASVIDSQAKAMAQLDHLEAFLSTIVPSRTGSVDLSAPGAIPAGEKAILGNTRSISRIKGLARWAGIYSASKDDVGRNVERYGDWTLIDMGEGADGSTPIVPSYAADADEGGPGASITGLTDLYAVTFGLDALHGASMAGKPLVQTWMPDWSTPGAVKEGEVELGPAAVVLRNTKSAGVLRKVKV